MQIELEGATGNQQRRIDLVTGRTFYLHCQGDRGFEDLTVVWYYGDEAVPVVSISDSNRLMRYAYLEERQWTLVLVNFTGGYVGLYKCQGIGNDVATITVGEGMTL